MDQITRWEWHGNPLIFTLLCLSGIFLPFAVIYFMTHLIRIQEQIADAAKLTEYLQSHPR